MNELRVESGRLRVLILPGESGAGRFRDVRPIKRLLLWCGFVSLILASTLRGQVFWSQPFQHWTRDQALSLLSDSPWATQVLLSGSSRTGESDDDGAQRTYTVRLFSALPIRQAFLRVYQLQAGYDEMTAEKKRLFDERFQSAAEVAFDQYIVVSLDVVAVPQSDAHQIEQFLQNSRTEFLKPQAFLINDRQQKIELASYYPPTPDGSGAKFLFPRRVDGGPSVGPEDRTLQFQFLIPPTGDRIDVRWDLRRMSLHDRLEL